MPEARRRSRSRAPTPRRNRSRRERSPSSAPATPPLPTLTLEEATRIIQYQATIQRRLVRQIDVLTEIVQENRATLEQLIAVVRADLTALQEVVVQLSTTGR